MLFVLGRRKAIEQLLLLYVGHPFTLCMFCSLALSPHFYEEFSYVDTSTNGPCSVWLL